MLNLLKMIRADAEAAHTQFDPVSTPAADVQQQYQWHFDEIARKLGFAGEGCRVTAVQSGQNRAKLPIVVMTIRLEHWLGKRSLLLLLSLPVLDKSVRRTLESSWLPEASEFGGVWFHASNVAGVPSSFTRKLVQLIDWLSGPDSTPAAAPGHAGTPAR